MNNLLKEMHAFLDGQDNRFAAALSDLPTRQIDEFNQYLANRITASGQALDTLDQLSPSAPAPDAVTPSATDAWAAQSWSDPAALKVQIDQHLSVIRTELQAFFGVFTQSELSAAAAQLEGLSLTTLIDGAKSHTHSLMDLLVDQQGAPSSLVDDVLTSMNQVMDAHSVVTADTPPGLEGLLQSWPPPVASALVHGAEDAAPLTAHQGASTHADDVLIDQLQSAALAVPLDPGPFSAAYATASAPKPMQLAESLFSPLSTTASPDLMLPGGPLHFRDHV